MRQDSLFGGGGAGFFGINGFVLTVPILITAAS